MSAPLFLAPPGAIAPGVTRLALDGDEGRHAATVRRVRAGERVDVADGLGVVASCVVASAGANRLELEITERREVPAPRPSLVVVQALPKGERAELAVASLTEVGVDAIVPWSAQRCVTRWTGPRADRGLARWRSTARESTKQARRPWLPQVHELATTEQVAERLAGAALAVVLHEDGTEPLAALEVPASGDVVLVVGPEGGITDEELAAFASAGARVARLGPTVLRTSTAGTAAAAVILARSGRWSGASG